MRNLKKFRPTLSDRLEDRTVPSALLGRLTALQALPTGGTGAANGLTGLGDGGGRLDARGLGGHSQGGCQGQGSQLGASSTLTQDARLVQQAFQTFYSSYLSAAAALRLTATSTAGPSQAGLDAFHSAIGSALTTLNSSIASSLGNLTNTGSTLTSTINGFTSALSTQLQSAAAGLDNSSNSALLALNREVQGYVRNALNQSVNAIRNDAPSGTITAATLRTYNQAVRTATQTFRTAISNAAQASISGGTALDSAAVTSAVSNLQAALTSAVNGLGTGFTSSASNPSSTIATDLATLSTDLTGIAAPTSGNTSSARLFLRTVSSVLSRDLGLINQAVLTGVNGYNTSLL